MGSVRFILAVSVIFAHVELGHKFLVGGLIAVQSFYMISGFLISFVLLNSPAYVDVKRFWANRILRLYPLYIIALIFGVIANIFLYSDYFLQYIEIDILERILIIFSNIFIVGQDIIHIFEYDSNGLSLIGESRSEKNQLHNFILIAPAWTIAIELSFYFIAPFIIRRPFIIICLLAISIVLRFVFIFSGYGLNDPWIYRFFPLELAWFLLGAISHQFILPVVKRVDIKFKGLKWVIFGFTIITVISYPIIPLATSMRILIVLSVVLSSLPWLFLVQENSAWETKIGELSYPIYIFHWIVILVLSKSLYSFSIIKVHSPQFLRHSAVSFSVVFQNLLVTAFRC